MTHIKLERVNSLGFNQYHGIIDTYNTSMHVSRQPDVNAVDFMPGWLVLMIATDSLICSLQYVMCCE